MKVCSIEYQLRLRKEKALRASLLNLHEDVTRIDEQIEELQSIAAKRINEIQNEAETRINAVKDLLEENVARLHTKSYHNMEAIYEGESAILALELEE